ncbi:hypothetical protein G9A89_011884 [Geosiphon pyriformis]|nr:hypothetical protein G9A89_011884 [Geosiphon pyriformis]
MPGFATPNTTPRRHSLDTPGKTYKEIQVPLNDDEKEKRLRRKSLLELRRKSSSLATPTKESGSNGYTTPKRSASRQLEVLTPILKIPMEQMYVNFEEWMKMATDNKINANNSWKLALIDYFHEMSLLKEGDSINFQKASCTLDGCVKVYTSRVDSVATETGKLLSGLADSFKDDDEVLVENEEKELEQRAKKKASRAEVTLAKDYSSLMVKKLDVEFSIDPLFKKTSADFDEGGAQGLLLNRLSIDDNGKIIFDSGDAMPEDNKEKDAILEEEDNVEQNIDITKLRSEFLPQLQQIFQKNVICSSIINKFEFVTDNVLDIASPLEDGLEEREDTKEEEDLPELIEEEKDFFDGDDDILGEAFANDILDEQDSEEYHATNTEESQRRLSQKEFITAMGANQDAMFSYFDSAFLRNWAGPEHWKLKRTVKEKSSNGEEPKKKKEKPPFSVNFLESEDVDENLLFLRGGSIINLPKSCENVAHKHLLPDDMHFSSRKLLQLFLKPRFMFNSKRDRSKIGEGNHGNKEAGLDEHFWGEDREDAIEDDQASFPDMTMATGGETFFRDEYATEDDLEGDYVDQLVSHSKRNKPTFVNYAKTAKRIDVKKLKENIWKTLTDFDETDKTLKNSSTSAGATKNHVTNSGLVQAEKKFTEIIEDLKKIYPERKMKDISVSFCFICLLHLANEKNLRIIGDENLAELCIFPEMGDR